MSVPEIPPSPPQAPPPARSRGPGRVVSVILVLIGIVLLLPGICSLYFMAVIVPGKGGVEHVVGVSVVSFVIVALVIAVIVYAIRHR